jgi:error-prone DNA polymerase
LSFIELQSRSAFSFLRGASNPEDVVAAAADAGMPAIALTDRMGVYGSVRAHQAAREAGLRAIVGSELAMEDGSALPVLVRTRTGYQNLCRLLTQAQLRNAKGEAKVRWAELPAFTEGLIALCPSGDADSPLRRAWTGAGPSGFAQAWARIERAFPHGQRAILLQRHQLRGETHWNQPHRDLAASTGTPLIASNGPLYARAPARRVQDVFTCLRHHTHLDAAGQLLASNNERYIKGAEALRPLFADCPETIEASRRLADTLEFSLENLGYEFPRFPVPEGETEDSFLTKITGFGAQSRYGSVEPKVRDQLRRELDLIIKLGFSGYFLIVWDIVNFCREQRIMVQGRGSAANSAVCYALGITPVDPVGANLLFERFLSEGRQSWPDIDLDLPSGERREAVIQEVYRRYGERGAAMTANVITYRGRSAVREIGKSLNFPEDLINRFSDLFSRGDYPHTLDFRQQMEQAGIGARHPRAATLFTLYKQLYGLPRHLGQHSGGMIICRGRLDTVMPLENASMPGRVVAQWDKDDCEDMGIIKVDLLGLGMMAVLEDAVTIAAQRGRPVDLARIPKDDPATYALLNAADTVGVFQVESRAQMATLPRLKPKCFYDIVVEVAIVRPGPIVGQLAHPYLERRAGREPVEYIHPDVRPILERTLGVPLFQEQVLKMAMVLADFSGSEAEELRRAMSFHRSEERMQKVQVKLYAAMRKKGHRDAVIEKVVDAISSFALYGFPESHAISFGLLAYASAYLKVHYAAEFYAGLLNNQPMGFYSPATLIQDAKRHGLRFLPPCVIASALDCTVLDDRTVRLGLKTVRGVSRVALARLLDARARAAFADLSDFRRRVRLEIDEGRALALSGALHALSRHRRDALWQMEDRWQPDELFAHAQVAEAGPPSPAPRPAPLREMSYGERLHADYSTTGSTTGPHPMAMLRPRLPAHYVSARDLRTKKNGQTVTVAGAVICRQRPGTAKGVVFISLEDETGIANIIVYPKLFERDRLKIISEPFLRILGRLQHVDQVIHIKAWKIEPLSSTDLPTGASHDFH